MKLKNTLFLILFFFGSIAQAQLISGLGIMGGGTASKQKWEYSEPDLKLNKKYLLGLNACLFVELFQHDFIRWRSELQFNQKGAKEIVSTPDGEKKYKHRVNYASFNNFLILRYELFAIIPYVLAGPRVEFPLTKKSTLDAAKPILNDFEQFHINGSVGAGVEFVAYGPFKFFTEAHFNPDFNFSPAYNKNNLTITHTAWELRAGLKYAIQGSGDCPPVLK